MDNPYLLNQLARIGGMPNKPVSSDAFNNYVQLGLNVPQPNQGLLNNMNNTIDTIDQQNIDKEKLAEKERNRNYNRALLLGVLADAVSGRSTVERASILNKNFEADKARRNQLAKDQNIAASNEDFLRKSGASEEMITLAKSNPNISNQIIGGIIKNQFNQPGDSSTSAIDNLNHLNNLYGKLNSSTDENEKESIQRQINDFQGILGTKRYDVDFEADKAAAIEKARQGGVSVTPLQKKIDEAFSPKAIEFESGGKAQVEGNIANLQNVIGILKDGKNVSGPFIGLLPEGVQSFTNPQALAILGNIRDIVFQSLREKLGAQFTEKEGDRLVAAAYDQRLSEEENIKRLERLLKITQDAAIAKQNMVNYYGEKGTLAGYESTPLTFNSLMDSFIAPDLANKSDDEIRAMFKNGDKDTRQAILRYVEKNKGE